VTVTFGDVLPREEAATTAKVELTEVPPAAVSGLVGEHGDSDVRRRAATRRGYYYRYRVERANKKPRNGKAS
jgi:hypothetical protein